MARKYSRDRRGRFSSTGATARGGRLTSASGKRYQTKTVKAPASSPVGMLRKRAGSKQTAAAAPASSIRRTGGLKRTPAGNQIVSAKQRGKAPIGLKANAIRTYKPATGRGHEAAMGRFTRRVEGDVKSLIKDFSKQKPKIQNVRQEASNILRKLGRSDARAWTQRGQKGIKGDMARIETSQFTGRMIKGVRETIQRRAQRAADAAGRGSKAGRKAQGIYARQMAYTGAGKPKAAKNAIKPGPKGTWKRKPRRRKG